MGSWKFEGLDTFINLSLETIKRTDRVVGRSIYPGAKIMSNEIKRAIDSLPVERRPRRGRRTTISEKQKQGLQESFGIAKIRKDKWGYNVKAGFDGYNEIKTKKYPKGQPNAMIARSLNSGTSFLRKNPFIDRTVESNKQRTIEAIEKQFDKELERIWNK